MRLNWDNEARTEVNCLACGNLSFEIDVSVEFEEQNYNFIRCRECRSLTSFPGPKKNADVYGDFGNAGVNHYVDIGAGVDFMLRWMPRLRDEGNFVEVGCGFGYPLFAASLFGEPRLGMVGVDESSLAIKGSVVLGFQLLPPFEVQKIEGSATAIFASEVIEHVEDPRAFLTYLSQLCSATNQCTVVLTTPNSEWVTENKNQSMLLSALSPGVHSVLFSKTALTDLCKEVFDEVEIIEINERLIARMGNGIGKPEFANLNYLEFLKLGASRLEQSSPRVAAGLKFRHFKELVNIGHWEASREVANSLLAFLSPESRAILFSQSPVGLDYEASLASGLEGHLERHPFWLSVFCFYLAGLARGEGSVGNQIHFLERANELMSLEYELFPELSQEQSSLLDSALFSRLQEAVGFLGNRYPNKIAATFARGKLANRLILLGSKLRSNGTK